jgi:hypothetical protein
MPNAAVSGDVSGAIECAHTPAKSARTSGVLKRFARWLADGSPLNANLAIVTGSLGTDRIGASTVVLSASVCLLKEPMSER